MTEPVTVPLLYGEPLWVSPAPMPLVVDGEAGEHHVGVSRLHGEVSPFYFVRGVWTCLRRASKPGAAVFVAWAEAREAELKQARHAETDLVAQVAALGVAATNLTAGVDEVLRKLGDTERHLGFARDNCQAYVRISEGQAPIVDAARVWGRALREGRHVDAAQALDRLFGMLGLGTMHTNTSTAERRDGERAEAEAIRDRCAEVADGFAWHGGEHHPLAETIAETIRSLGPEAPWDAGAALQRACATLRGTGFGRVADDLGEAPTMEQLLAAAWGLFGPRDRATVAAKRALAALAAVVPSYMEQSAGSDADELLAEGWKRDGDGWTSPGKDGAWWSTEQALREMRARKRVASGGAR